MDRESDSSKQYDASYDSLGASETASENVPVVSRLHFQSILAALHVLAH